MGAPQVKDLDQRLKQLERRNSWMWWLAAALMIALGLSLLTLQFTGIEEHLTNGTGYILIVGLSGLVVLFSLYMLLKQSQLNSLRGQLVQAVVLQESMRSRLAGISSLFEGVANVGVQLDLETMLQTLSDHISASLNAEQASVMLVDAELGALRCVATTGNDSDYSLGSLVRIGEGIPGWVAEHNQPFAFTPAQVRDRFPGAFKPGSQISAGLCVPLSLPDQVIGVLNINRLAAGPAFTEEDTRVVNVFAAHIAIAIRRVRERRLAQEALEEREQQLHQSQKMESLGRLAGGVAHDFNNLLTVVLTYAARLLREIPTEDRRRASAEKICDAAERCAALTRQLLTFSRKQVVEMRSLDLNACVNQMGSLLRHLIGENIELVLVLHPELGRIRADASQIEQVIMNLVVNARDALPMGGRLTIETANVTLTATEAAAHVGAQAGSYVKLSVRDTGFGMDSQTQAQVFEPFFTTKEMGTGLGLSTVYGVVQQGAGFIMVDSQPGRGTTFHIHLPRIDAPAERPQEETETNAVVKGGATILLVEDEDAVRELVRDILETHGYQVIVASWAGEAVMLGEAYPQPIDLLISDVVMPGESGGELAMWMSRARPEMPVLFMSGYTDDDIVRHGVQHDGAAFLAKPFSEECLLAKVREMIEGRSRRKQTSEPLDQAA